jgi:small subunit ribosomal protein S16
VAVKIRLKRMGKIRQPYYRVVVVDSRKKRDGRVIEEIGKYHPKSEPSLIEVTSERAQYWLGVGAQPSEAVAALLKVTGDWQKFKGLPGTEGSLKVAEAKRDKAEIFNEALKDSAKEPKAEAVTKKSAAKKADKAEKPAEDTPAEAATADAEVPAGETPEAAAASADVEGEAQPAEADKAEATADADKPAEA